MSSCNSNCSEAAVAAIFEKYDCRPHNLIPLLHDLQSKLGCLSPEVMETVADQLGITVARVHGVATFYSLFYTEPHGKHVVRVCDSPPCHIEGSRAIRKAVSTELGISEGEMTEDGNFSFEIVSCMGLCGVAPAMMVNDDVYGNLTPDGVANILREYISGTSSRNTDAAAGTSTGWDGISESRPKGGDSEIATQSDIPTQNRTTRSGKKGGN